MAKPTPLPLGKPSPHVMQSRGAENYLMNFYITSYSTGFTKPNIEVNKSKLNDIPSYTGGEIFKPRSAPEHNKSGFTSNVRPQIYYNRTLDEFDNPEMGRDLVNNYISVTHTHYQPYRNNDGLVELPSKVAGQKTAFTQTANNHNPRPKDVLDQFIDTKIHAPFDVIPNQKTRLHQIKNKDPIASENFNHGPSYMSTEYAAKYDDLKNRNKKLDKLDPAIGPKEISGFESNKEKEDVLTGFKGERWLLNDTRPTGITDYKTKYVPYEFVRSDTELPNISNIDHTRETTYTKSFKPSDINLKSGPFVKNPTEYKENYLGEQKPHSKLAEQLGQFNLGPKELGGQVRCERGFVQTLDDPRRFITNYHINHFDMNAKGKDREGFVTGGINGNFDDAYFKNRQLHQSNPINTTADLYNMDSYQSRSLRATNKFYDDHTHDHKFALKNTVVTFSDSNPYSAKLL